MRVLDGVPVPDIERAAEEADPAAAAQQTVKAVLGFIPFILGWVLGYLVYCGAAFRIGYYRGRVAAAGQPKRAEKTTAPDVATLSAVRDRVVG